MGLSITHNCSGSKFRSEFDIGESCEATSDNNDAGLWIAGSRKIVTEARELDEVECQCSSVAASITGLRNEAIEDPDLALGQSDVRWLVGRSPRHHRQSQDSPAQDEEYGHQVGETVSSAQFRVFGATTTLQDFVEDLEFPAHCVPIDFFACSLSEVGG